MIQRAHDIINKLQDRVRTTLEVVADIAESVGVPSKVTSLLHRSDVGVAGSSTDGPWADYRPGRPAAFEPKPTSVVVEDAQPVVAQQPSETVAPSTQDDGKDGSKKAASSAAPKARTGAARPAAKRRGAQAKRRSVAGNTSLSQSVQPLQPDDAIKGSTYLARIVWALGIARLEGLGPLRPADIARMVMARSAVSLEPPNIARYIRRSNPACITVDHTEGSSSFYKLNAQGKKLFEQKFAAS